MKKPVSGTHIIKKQSIQIDFNTISDGFALQNRVSELFYEELLPGMEVLFNEFADENHFVTLDTLKIDCGVLAAEHWDGEWVEKALHGLRQELLAVHKTITDADVTETEKLQENFFHYLQYGYLPWNSHVLSMRELEQVVPDKLFLGRLRSLIQAELKASSRLIYGFSETFISKVIEQLAKESVAGFNTFASLLNVPFSLKEKRLAQIRVVETLCKDTIEVQSLQEEVTNKKELKEQSETEYIYIQNAGIVILHPFLLQLFEACGLIKEEKWEEATAAQHTSTAILQYLAVGIDDLTEPNLLLNKILCGLNADDVIIPEEKLTEAIKKECDELLTKVITNWAVLKNTGVESFRETFLQRNGKLSRVNSGWRLQVEQKSVDVLLSFLPWGIGTVKLPWMRDVLYTEWR